MSDKIDKILEDKIDLISNAFDTLDEIASSPTCNEEVRVKAADTILNYLIPKKSGKSTEIKSDALQIIIKDFDE